MFTIKIRFGYVTICLVHLRRTIAFIRFEKDKNPMTYF